MLEYTTTKRDGTKTIIWQLCDCHGHLFLDRKWSEVSGHMYRSTEGYAHIILYELIHGPLADNEFLRHADGNKGNNQCTNIVAFNKGEIIRCTKSGSHYKIMFRPTEKQSGVLIKRVTEREEALGLVGILRTLTVTKEFRKSKDKQQWLKRQLS